MFNIICIYHTQTHTETETKRLIDHETREESPSSLRSVEIIMKCQTCVRARLRHLTWPINLGLIGLCHNTETAAANTMAERVASRRSILMCFCLCLWFCLVRYNIYIYVYIFFFYSAKFVIFTDADTARPSRPVIDIYRMLELRAEARVAAPLWRERACERAAFCVQAGTLSRLESGGQRPPLVDILSDSLIA